MTSRWQKGPMLVLAALALLVRGLGCGESSSDGNSSPPGTVQEELTGEAKPICAGKSEGNSCSTNPCMPGTCQKHKCVITPVVCPGNQVCFGGMCVCGNGGCGSACTNPQSDPNNCGMCGHACPATNATATCFQGQCGLICNAGFVDCDTNPANGCETNIVSDVHNCGGCGDDCFAGANGTVTCVQGHCGLNCNSGFADCNNNPVGDGCETNISSDVNNCGACGHACLANQTCVNGVCTG